MNRATPLPTAVRVVVAGPLLLLGLVTLTGCRDSYPMELTYPLRNDILVLKRPTELPPKLDPPGQFYELAEKVEALAEKNKEKDAIVNPANLSVEQKSQLREALQNLFGTPAYPAVRKMSGADTEALQLRPSFLHQGSKLYRRHCLHCHGVTGNGQGPTGPWVNPHPRDYRRGLFKFTSSRQPESVRKPRREDLLRTLRQGIEGTSMPSFGLLEDKELQQLASYVVHLSLRGQVEFETMRELLRDQGSEADKGEDAPVKLKIEVDGNELTIAEFAEQVALADAVKQWREAEESLIVPEGVREYTPEEFAKSVENGKNLFVGAVPGKADCRSCHNDFGRKTNLMWDDWGTIVRPANLSAGAFRGGRRPLDLYWRISYGISGVGMPQNLGGFKAEEIWDIVNFLQVLPYKDEREKYGIHIDATGGHHQGEKHAAARGTKE